MNAKAKRERAAHIDAIVAAAPVPTSEQLDELARLLLPSLTRQAMRRLGGAA